MPSNGNQYLEQINNNCIKGVGINGTPFYYDVGNSTLYSVDITDTPLSISDHKDNFNTTMDRPAGLAIIVSQNCNLTCSYCLAQRGTYGLSVCDMNIDEIKHRIKEYSKNTSNFSFIKFFGGEPTLRMDLVAEICRYVHENLNLKDIKFGITTNGAYGKPEEHLKVWTKYRVSVSVSIDGPQYIHDMERKTENGNGSFLRAVNYCNVLKNNHFPFAVVGVFDNRHITNGETYLSTIKYLNSISPLTKIQYIESIGDAAGSHEFLDSDRKSIEVGINEAFY